MKKIAVSGATGYIGRHVVRALKEHGFYVRALSRSASRLSHPGPFDAPEVRHYCDEVHVGEATDKETLKGLYDGMDYAFSSVGISRQRDGLTFEQVDHQANRNLIELAEGAGIQKFVYVSLWDPEVIEHLEITRAHEKVVSRLRASKMPHTIVRPAGYFSDMGALLDMAKMGRAIILGHGHNKMNPIHGRDVAEVCVQAVTSGEQELGCGGPDVMTQNEAAELAFEVLGKQPKLVHVPLPALSLLAKGISRLNRQFGDLADFLVTAGEVEAVAPQVGTMRLRDYFADLARA